MYKKETKTKHFLLQKRNISFNHTIIILYQKFVSLNYFHKTISIIRKSALTAGDAFST